MDVANQAIEMIQTGQIQSELLYPDWIRGSDFEELVPQALSKTDISFV